MLKCDFVIYADLEAILENLSLRKRKKENFPSTSYEKKHAPSGFSFVVIDKQKTVILKKTYRNPDCIYRFFEDIQIIPAVLKARLKRIVKIKPLTVTQELKFKFSKICHICRNPFTISTIKVKDHDHSTGEF